MLQSTMRTSTKNGSTQLNDAGRTNISHLATKKIQEMTGAKNIKLKPEVDPSLLGGFVVTYGKDGSGYIDMSVAGQVRQLKNEIVVA